MIKLMLTKYYNLVLMIVLHVLKILQVANVLWCIKDIQVKSIGYC